MANARVGFDPWDVSHGATTAAGQLGQHCHRTRLLLPAPDLDFFRLRAGERGGGDRGLGKQQRRPQRPQQLNAPEGTRQLAETFWPIQSATAQGLKLNEADSFALALADPSKPRVTRCQGLSSVDSRSACAAAGARAIASARSADPGLSVSKQATAGQGRAKADNVLLNRQAKRPRAFSRPRLSCCTKRSKSLSL